MQRESGAAAEAPTGGLSLATKGILVVAIPVCALLAALAVFYLFERQSHAAVERLEHTYQVRGEIRRVLTRMMSAETGVRGYLLTRRETFLEPYRQARKEMEGSFDALDGLVSGNAEESRLAAELKAQVARALQPMEALQRDVAAGRAAAGLDEMERARSRMDELRRQAAVTENLLQGALDTRKAQQEHAERRLEIAIFAGALLGLLGGVAAALLFTTRIVRRVHQVEDEARRVAEGMPIVEEIRGGDEIARLEHTLKETSTRLATQSEELRAAHRDLEQRVRERTAELSAANEAVRALSDMNQAVTQSSPLAIWALDLDGNVSFWNAAAERIFGWTEPEVMGRPLPLVPPDQHEEYARWLERFRRGESLNGIERTRLKKDGSSIDVLIWTSPLRDAGGNIRGTIAIDSDLSEYKLLEQQFRQSQKLEAVGRLAGGVAHDFNNLLTVISGYSELLIAEAGNQPLLLEYGREVLGAAERAGGLTAQLLAFSRRQMSQPRILDLNEAVSHSTKLLRRVIGEDVEIVTHLEPALGKVKADPIHVDQVIMNLVVNARDAMGDGGTLTIETANRRLDADYVERHIGVGPGDYCMLAVSDTGSGMAPDVRNRIFEPFFTTKESGKGTGLGLSIVYGIVKQSGGEIMVYSEPGRGTTFKIYLPRVTAAEEAPAAERQAVEVQGTETVVLCEDDRSIRQLVHTMLAKQGYRVIDAETPAEAIRLAGDSRTAIHLLLTDLVLPGMAGTELANVLRQRCPGIKVLYMSGYTDNHVSRGWEIEPGAPFIQKPFTADALATKVREALGRSAKA